MKLISMTEFVFHDKDNQDILRLIINYANFLKQPLKLEMFVPCDDEGNVLEYPLTGAFTEDKNVENGDYTPMFCEYRKEYQLAKEKVLFEGCSFDENEDFVYFDEYVIVYCVDEMEDIDIEHLLMHTNNLTLTQSALKQIGL